MNFSKRSIILLCSLAAIGCAVIVHRLVPPSSVRAQTGCTSDSFKGTYVYAHTGYIVTSDNYFFFAAAGTAKADGNGNFSSVDTAALDGQITRNRQLSGTYNVTSACTGSMVFKDGSQTVANMDFSLTNGGKGIKYIQTDSGAVITGAGELQ